MLMSSKNLINTLNPINILSMNFLNLVNNVLLLEDLDIGKGTNFRAIDIGDGKIRKVPLIGDTIPKNEYTKLQFMKDNESSEAFVKIYSLTPKEVITDKVQTISRTLYKWARYYDYSETNDTDILSDWLHNVFSNKEKWSSNIFHFDSLNADLIQTKQENNPTPLGSRLLSYKDTFSLNVKVSDLLKKLRMIEYWPNSKLDIHASNVGLINNQLVVFDM